MFEELDNAPELKLNHPASAPSDWDVLSAFIGRMVQEHGSDSFALDTARALGRLRGKFEDNSLAALESPFICPKCGGYYFGRDTAKGQDGRVEVLKTVRCHNVKCGWRGEWPPIR